MVKLNKNAPITVSLYDENIKKPNNWVLQMRGS